jgi:hypothetical protein
MFGFFKRKAQADSTVTSEALGPWGLSEDEALLEQVSEYTYVQLDRLKVDLGNQKFKTKDGEALGIGELAQRLRSGKPDMPLQHIEDSIMSWLEEAFEPEGILDGDMEEAAEMAVAAWLEAYEEDRSKSEIK